MNSLHPEILEIIKALAAGNGKVLVRVAQAARMLDCDVKSFKKQYINTNLVTPLYPYGSKYAKFNVFDLMRAPELMKQRDEFIKTRRIEDETQHRAKNINELLDELGPMWKPKTKKVA